MPVRPADLPGDLSDRILDDILDCTRPPPALSRAVVSRWRGKCSDAIMDALQQLCTRARARPLKQRESFSLWARARADRSAAWPTTMVDGFAYLGRANKDEYKHSLSCVMLALVHYCVAHGCRWEKRPAAYPAQREDVFVLYDGARAKVTFGLTHAAPYFERMLRLASLLPPLMDVREDAVSFVLAECVPRDQRLGVDRYVRALDEGRSAR
jgi:hypothetical protein